MKYRNIKIELKEYPKRLKREFLVREDVNLIELGIIFLTSLNFDIEYDGLFSFKTRNKKYVLEQEDVEGPNTLFMSEHKMTDLDFCFNFHYESCDEYDFNCTMSSKAYTKQGNNFVYLLSGKGEGILEEGRDELFEYFKGNPGPANRLFLDESNLLLEDIRDYDDYDVDFYKYLLEDSIPYVIHDFIDRCHKQEFELNIENIDLAEYKSQDEILEYYSGSDEDIELDDDLKFNDDDLKAMELIFMEAATYMLKETDFGRAEFDRLSEKYDLMDIIGFTMEKMVPLVKDVMHGENAEFNKKLKEALKKVK